MEHPRDHGPAPGGQRHAYLDMMRGFALLGIFLGNIGFFSAYVLLGEERLAALPTPSLDRYATFLTRALVDGKFYSIFSMLFGIGFAIQMESAKRAGRAFGPFFIRRMLILLAFGLLHLLFWPGDILALYALVGLVLLLFRSASERSLLYWAIALVLSPIVLYALMWLSGGAINPANPVFYLAYLVETHLGFDGTGNLSAVIIDARPIDLIRFNLAGVFYRYGDITFTSRFPKVLGMFLLGYWCVRRGIVFDLRGHRHLLRRTLFWGTCIGLPANLALAYLFGQGSWYQLSWLGFCQTVAYALGVAPLALAYAAGLALLCLGRGRDWWMGWLAPAGRMALTNYLAQSVAGLLVFYGLGLGLAGRVGAIWFLPAALLLFTVQTLYSRWWMARFRFGPMEWIWRQLTYGQRFALRRAAEETA